MVGAGGLGAPVATYLVGAGVGKITVIDHDTVSETNLHRQVLYRESDIGKPKADVAKQTLIALNRDVDIIAHTARLSPDIVNEL